MATLKRKMRQQDNKLKKDYAKVSNELLEAFVRKNNRTALKILFYLARAELTQEPARLHRYALDPNAICEYCEIDMRTLKSNLRAMQETSISITTEDAKSYMSVLPRIDFTNRGKVTIDMYDEVVHLIKDVKRKFTVIDARQVMMLKSKHAIRMLMILERINTYDAHVAKVKECELDELNALFGTNYKRIAEFERFIIKPVKQELDSFSKLTFDYDVKTDKTNPNDRGRRKLTGVRIYLIDNLPQGKLF